jgi:hypothetical protein
MPESKIISSRNITLAIGIIVAIFLFLSSILLNKNEPVESSGNSKSETSQTLNKIHEGAVSFFAIIKKIR